MVTARRFQLAAILCFSIGIAYAQDSGMPFIRNYKPQEYRASQQNWSIVQDNRGVMFFANNDGMLEYDGISWRLLKLPGTRSLAFDSVNQRIYIGLENDLGYVEPDRSGEYRFYSLKDKIPQQFRDISTIYKVCLLKGKVLFMAENKIYIYSDGKITVLQSSFFFHTSFVVNGRYYVRENERGLLYLENDRLVFVEGSEMFADERIHVMLPYGKNEILIVSRTRGVIIHSPLGKVKFHKPHHNFDQVDKQLLKHGAYHGSMIPNGDFVLGTFTNGIIIFDSTGNLKSLYNTTKGLQDNTILYIYPDKNGQIWAGLDNGISLIQNNLPFKLYNNQNGLNGSPMSLKIFKGRLYVGTGQYLHVQDDSGNFKIIEGRIGQNFQIYVAGETLLVANNSGFMELKDNKLVAFDDEVVITIIPLVKFPDYLLIGGISGLYIYEKKGSRWKVKNKIKGFDKSVYAVAQDTNGSFWVSTLVDLFKVNVNNELDRVVLLQQYKTDKGLPSNYGSPFRLNSGEVVFGTDNGIYRYDAEHDSFQKHPDFPMLTGKSTIFHEVENGDIWFDERLENGDYHRGLLKFENGKFKEHWTPLNKFSDLGSGENRENIATTANGTVYFGTPAGLLRYNLTRSTNFNQPFNTLIRRVYSKDSIIYNGERTSDAQFRHVKGIQIPFASNDIVFHFAATSYEDSEKNLYSYRLVGSDTTWSTWKSDYKKEFSNLSEGEYIFEVKSKNQYKTMGSVASYSFIIMPPWYRTWWAFLCYALILVSVIFILVHLRTKKFKARSRVLEKIVEERTHEIQDQKNNVEKLSIIGRDITSSLSIENIIHTIYKNVNTLMDASIFTIGLHNSETRSLEFPVTIEKNQLLPPFAISLSDNDRLGAWCFNNKREVIINDYAMEYKNYVSKVTPPIAGETPQAILYLPLWNKEDIIGVISAQSFTKNAYTDYHVNMFRNLATYSAIAVENADAYRHLALLFNDLKTTQDKLVTQSKLAALGELTAGIAHEIQNPLNFVTNFSEVSNELLDEMNEELASSNIDEAIAIAGHVKTNLEKITHHGKRADAIVKGMLQHSTSGGGITLPTDINALAEEFMRLAYHGLKAKDNSFTATTNTDFDTSIGKINIAPQDIGRAILNLLSNSFFAVKEKKKMVMAGQENDYEPSVSLTTKKLGDWVEIKVSDNGIGIPNNILDKIFQPFFTTKPSGEGTGLGLSLSYEIITKGHGGELKVDTVEGEGTTFTIRLPQKHSMNESDY